MDDQVTALAEKSALVANSLRYVDEENIRFRNMLLNLDDLYYNHDSKVHHLNSNVQSALQNP